MECIIKSMLWNIIIIKSLCIESNITTESSKGLYSIYLITWPYWTINIITCDYSSICNISKYNHNINIAMHYQ
jgi:hypothetical protein